MRLSTDIILLSQKLIVSFVFRLYSYLNWKNNPFESHLRTIEQSASELIRLQEQLKKGHTLSSNDQQRYSDYIDRLSEAAQKLAKLEEQKAESLDLAYPGKICVLHVQNSVLKLYFFYRSRLFRISRPFERYSKQN